MSDLLFYFCRVHTSRTECGSRPLFDFNYEFWELCYGIFGDNHFLKKELKKEKENGISLGRDWQRVTQDQWGILTQRDGHWPACGNPHRSERPN
jgi:hypothetical protein